MAIDERSAPSEVKAPAMAIERAVPKLNCVCDSSAKFDGMSMSLLAIRPPVTRWLCAAAGAAKSAPASSRPAAFTNPFICCTPFFTALC